MTLCFHLTRGLCTLLVYDWSSNIEQVWIGHLKTIMTLCSMLCPVLGTVNAHHPHAIASSTMLTTTRVTMYSKDQKVHCSPSIHSHNLEQASDTAGRQD
jgi:hypothetical protein